MIVVRAVSFARRADRTKALVDATSVKTVPVGRVPRVARLMALAIQFNRLVREGKVVDLSELARIAHVTQPRMTQIMNLNHLAPDIQDTLLHLPPTESGRDPIFERDLRPIAAEIEWNAQRAMWRRLTAD